MIAERLLDVEEHLLARRVDAVGPARIKAEPIERGKPQGKNRSRRSFQAKANGRPGKPSAQGANQRFKSGRRAAA